MDAKKSGSIWTATIDPLTYAPLDGDRQVEVCIVGAGIAGMTTAYLLARDGRSVIVLDDGPVGGGMTAATTAHLASALDDRFLEIERLHGVEGSRLAAESHSAAIDRIASIVEEERIDCDFERLDGYLFRAPEHDADYLDREFEAAYRAGLGVEMVDRTPIPTFGDAPAIRFPSQGRFHPLKYLAGLARAIERYGGTIHSGSHVESVEGGEPARVTVGPYTVTANAVVVATNVPINDLLVIHTKQAPYMSYVVGIRVPGGSVPDALYWDTGDPYHYIRLQRLDAESDLLIVGGEDHKSGQADDTPERYDRLEKWTRERFPMAGPLEFTWAGQVMETIDGLAFIGHNPLDKENVYVATGDSGMGMTHGTIAGIVLTDLIVGRPNRWQDLYDPSRKTLRAAGEFTRETANMAAQFADWVTGGDVDDVDEIARDTGAVVRRGLTKHAVYRDAHGALHERSAVCPHLGCIVAWNDAAKTWDCPCHGSRFDKFGEVINGPANKGLSEIEED